MYGNFSDNLFGVIYIELETFFSINEQLKLFLLSCLLGIPVGIIYDIFRIIRIILPHNHVLTAIEDVLFFIIYSVILMCFTISAARADFRVYYIVGNIIGAGAYFFTVGNVITRIVVKFTYLIRKNIINPLTFTIKKAFYKKKY
ncbi:MAG: spore cortex biosynthesis protein YabQ [Oscillospiraceae bacterium]|nr:spore cortex biosynthesis protein YabQ [Oscillospiraceae bacterium]